MAPTIAERAANGEALNAADLTSQERDELLVWAREQNIGYKEIKRRFGFTQSVDTLRGMHMNAARNRPARVPSFTPEDDRLIQHAVQLYATGPLDQEKSLQGIWKSVKKYIRANGAKTTAGERSLKARWKLLRDGQAPPAEPRVGLAPSFAVFRNQPTSSDYLAAGMEWEEEYEALSEEEEQDEKKKAVDSLRDGQAPPAEPRVAFAPSFTIFTGPNSPTPSDHLAAGYEWEEHDPLFEEEEKQDEAEDVRGESPDVSEGEMGDALGEDYGAKATDGAEDTDHSAKADDEAEDSDDEETPRSRPRKG